MASRLELHEELCAILGTRNAYYDPPASVVMHYPAIRYKLSGKDLTRANNKIYRMTNRYDGVIIVKDPDSTIPDALLGSFETCSFGSPYTSDNLHHFPFTIYY